MTEIDWDGGRPLITARCEHCHKVAAKYWQHGHPALAFFDTPSKRPEQTT